MEFLKKSYDKFKKSDGKIFIYLSVFILLVVLLWKRIVSIFKPADDAKREAAQITNTNTSYYKKGAITADGYFLTGQGLKTNNTVSQAKQNAEELSALMKTYKGAKWYSVTFSFFGYGAISRIKTILNPNYPASYRRYVEQVYRDIYTENHNLQVDVRNNLTGFAGSSWWTNDLTKYFQ